MKKTIICNISMKEKLDKVLYVSDDQSIPVANKKVRYPICSFLEKTICIEDELKILLLVKKDKNRYYKRNMEYFKKELSEANKDAKAAIKYVVLDTEFSQEKSIHEQLMGAIVDELEDNSHILADITYGPKDLPIVIFSALNFAEKYLNCSVDNIIYGQASFENGQAVDTKICDMIPLYCLGALTNTIHSSEPNRARKMLKTLLSL